MTPDINLLDLADEVIEVSSDATPEEFFAPPLPDDGDHNAHLYLGDRGVKIERQRDKATGDKTGPAYVGAHIQAKLLDDQGEEKLSCFDQITSVVMEGVGTSRLHMMLKLGGVDVPSRTTFGELADLTRNALSQPFLIGVTTRWEAQEDMGNGRYETVLRGQKRFPPILDENGAPTGRYNPEVTNPKTGTKVRAQAKIIRYGRPS